MADGHDGGGLRQGLVGKGHAPDLDGAVSHRVSGQGMHVRRGVRGDHPVPDGDQLPGELPGPLSQLENQPVAGA